MPTSNAPARRLGTMTRGGEPVNLFDKIYPRAVTSRSTSEATLKVSATRQDYRGC